MNFRIADTFTGSLAKLSNDEQKAAKQTAFDLQMDASAPGLRFHKLERAKDRNFWSVSVNMDIRIIVHKTDASLTLCYVDHHDAAYRWAERRKLEKHPKTGAAQLIEIRETVREIEIPKYVESEVEQEVQTPAAATETASKPKPPAPPLFANIADDQFLAYGVPEEWLDDVKAATEDSLFAVCEHLPSEASEALLELAVGNTPQPAPVIEEDADPFEHPDAERRFRLVTDVEELRAALDSPWEKWTVFLHPAQRGMVEKDYNGPARVAGSAGTGKTVVALHRAAYLAKSNPSAKVLLTTYSVTLARALNLKLKRLLGADSPVLERITVRSIDQIGIDLYEQEFGKPLIPTRKMVEQLLQEARKASPDCTFGQRFVEAEWHEVIDAWQIRTWEEYRDIPRTGRRSRLRENHRADLWKIFAKTREIMHQRGLVTLSDVFAEAAKAIESGEVESFDYAIVDEAQDLGVPQLRLLAAIGGQGENALFFAGDLGQRIFQSPFSWRSLGVDIRGRSTTLRINYRTSQQIRQRADLLLPPELTDPDGNAESRKDTISVFSGPAPDIREATDEADEIHQVANWLKERTDQGIPPEEIGVFVRSEDTLDRARLAIRQAGLSVFELNGEDDHRDGHVALSTMHLAKGLEYRCVVVMACDDEVIPLQERIESIADPAELEEVYSTERHLLYVACTRAREDLLATGVEPVSEFLGDLDLKS
ncbi:MAG: 3'-5' exonuclease [Phycisphaerales bacterium]